ncbi:MAG: helix-turn-helix domain-containing protein [Oscillospiraceae bacterium]|jgi:AraC-like DNA-binding protein|nr:helix-turn-helix domain-containing protein [Oscillospiraceae bacterium]
MGGRRDAQGVLNSLRFFARRFGRRSAMIRALIYSLALGVALPSLLTITLFGVFSARAARQTAQVARQSLRQAAESINITLRALYRQMEREYRTNSTIIMGLESDHMTPVEYAQLFTTLGDLVYSNELFDSACVYNLPTDSVFSSIGVMQRSDRFYDAGLMELLRPRASRTDTATTHAVYPRRLRYTYGTTIHDLNAVTFVFGAGVSSAMAVNLDLRSLQAILTAGAPDPSARSLILSADGIVISDTDSEYVFSDVSGEAFFERIRGGGDQSGDFTEMVGGRASLVVYERFSQFTGLDWLIAQIYDKDALTAGMRDILGLVMVIGILVTMLLAFGLMAAMGQLLVPVGRMLRMAGDSAARQDAQANEFTYLEQSIQSLSASVEAFSRIDLPRLRDFFILNLMLDRPGPAFDAQCQRFGLKPDTRVSVGLLRPSVIEDNAVEARRGVSETLSSLPGVILLGESVGGMICCLLPPNADGGTIRVGGMGIAAGVSPVYPLRELRGAYQAAYTALEYTFLFGQEAVILYEDIARRESAEYYYPRALEKTLLLRIRAGVDVSETLDAFFEAAGEMSVQQSKLALRQLLMALLALFPEGESGPVQAGALSHINALLSLPTLDEARRWFDLLAGRLLDAQRSRRDERLNALARRIKEIVLSLYGDCSLSVEGIAEMVELSPNYVRKLFKDIEGVTLSRYIQDVRLEEAERLLSTTDIPANRVGTLVGFQEGSYFYTVFKRVTRSTPDEWRRKRTARREGDV